MEPKRKITPKQWGYLKDLEARDDRLRALVHPDITFGQARAILTAFGTCKGRPSHEECTSCGKPLTGEIGKILGYGQNCFDKL